MEHYKKMEKYNFNDYEDPSLQSKNRLLPRTYFRQYEKLTNALKFEIWY